MLYREIHQILRKTHLSAEQLAPLIGVSNMTIRRWLRADPREPLSYAHEQLVVLGLERMLTENLLPAGDEWAAAKVSRARARSVAAATAALGVKIEDLGGLDGNRERMLGFLRQIGISKNHQSNVEKNHAKITKFKSMGLDWKKPLGTLLQVVRSKKLTRIDKLIAYGALFYLLCPLDLIPDSVPLFGFTDDFAFVSLAACYYLTLAQKEKA